MATHDTMATLSLPTPADLRRAWEIVVAERSDHELACTACLPFALAVEGAQGCAVGRALAEADHAAHAAWTRARFGGAL